MQACQTHTQGVTGKVVGPGQDGGLDMLQHWLPIICQSINRKGGSSGVEAYQTLYSESCFDLCK